MEYTYDDLMQLYKAACSRENEANRDWSTATRKWIAERDALRAENERMAHEIDVLKAQINQLYEDMQ